MSGENDCRVRITKDIGSLYYSGKFRIRLIHLEKKIREKI